MAKPALQEEAVRLRVEQRQSLTEIRKQVPVSKGTLSLWLRNYPLTEEELSGRRVKAGQRGRGVRHVRKNLPSSPVLSSVLFPNAPSPKRLRLAAIGVAIEWFMSRGYMTSIPVDQASYDLIVDSEGGLKRVQIKTTTQKDSYGRWVVNIYKHVYVTAKTLNASGKCRNTPYSTNEIDLFFCLAGDNSVYVIPFDVVSGKYSLTLDRSYAEYRRDHGV